MKEVTLGDIQEHTIEGYAQTWGWQSVGPSAKDSTCKTIDMKPSPYSPQINSPLEKKSALEPGIEPEIRYSCMKRPNEIKCSNHE